ncbi:MAG TPA: hypothetical protein VGE26_10315 [Sphingobacteriaceae bacterium]
MKTITTNAFFLILTILFWASPSMSQNTVPAKLKYGKYSCTASKYRNGSFEFIPRGSFVITSAGKYTYYGFEKPSTGTFNVDKQGNLLFKGGYLDGGKAEKTDRPDKFFLVFPANPDNRWTSSWTGGK